MPILDTLLRAELALGRAQFRVIMAGLARAAKVSAGEATLEGIRVPYLYRRASASASHRSPTVLVHGFGGDKVSWLQLARAIPRERALLIPDLPGFGDAGAIPRERASARAQARVLAALVQHLGMRDAHWVGNSMGGGIIQRLALDFPERARTIALIGSVGPTVDKSWFLRELDRGENPLILRDVEKFEEFMSVVSASPPPMPRAIRRFFAHDRVGRAHVFSVLFDGWVNPAPGDGPPEGDELAKIRAPTLVIHGAVDRVIDVSTGRALAERIPGAKLEILPGIGHLPQLEASGRVARMCEAFARAAD